MRDSKVMRLLINFPGKDLVEFRDFVASPFFNKDSQVLEFLEMLIAALPDVPTSAEVLDRFFPDVPGDRDKRLDRLKNRLVQLVVHYVDYRARHRPEDRHLHALARLEEWWDRGEEKAHQKEAEALEQTLAADLERSSLRDGYIFLLAGHLASHAPHYDRSTRLQRLEQVWTSLDSVQKIQKLRYLCVLANHARVAGNAVPEWLTAELAAADSYVSPEDPLSRLYALCLDMQLDPLNEDLYAAFREALEAIAPQLAAGEARELYQYAINFQIRLFNRQQGEAAAEAIRNLYELLLQRGILLENGFISAWNYKNIVSLMARIGALDWLEGFMDGYEGFLRYDYADNAANFCRGLVAFYRKDFAETARRMELVLTDFRDVFWGLEARALLLQAHCERGRHEDLETVYHSARMYVGRTAGTEVSPEHQAGYRNFNRFVYKLSGIITGDRDRRTAKLLRLREAVLQADFLPNKSWLLEKIDLAG
jgi:hypothetical protein